MGGEGSGRGELELCHYNLSGVHLTSRVSASSATPDEVSLRVCPQTQLIPLLARATRRRETSTLIAIRRRSPKQHRARGRLSHQPPTCLLPSRRRGRPRRSLARASARFRTTRRRPRSGTRPRTRFSRARLVICGFPMRAWQCERFWLGLEWQICDYRGRGGSS